MGNAPHYATDPSETRIFAREEASHRFFWRRGPGHSADNPTLDRSRYLVRHPVSATD
jgi:hypothetical protein